MTASDLASATDEGRLTAWLAELSSSRFAPLRKSSTAIMAGMIDERPDIAGPRRPVPTRAGAGVTVEADDDEVGGGSTTAAPGLSDEPPPAAGPVDPKAVDGYRPSSQEQEAEKPNPLRRFGRFLARRLGG